MTKLTVDIADELPADRSEWDAVVDASGRPNIFCRRDFLQAWLDHYREGRRLRIYCARRDRRLVAALPLIGQLGRTHFKGLTNHYMFTFAPICRYDDHEAIGEILRRAFSDRLLARIKLGQMDADEPLVASLPQLVEGAGGRWLRTIQHVSPYIDTRGSYDAWLASLSSKFRGELRRKKRALEQIGEYRITHYHGSEPEFDAAFQQALDVEARSWKGQQGSTMIQQPVFLSYIRRLIALSIAEQGFTMTVLRAGDRLAAFRLIFYYRGREYYLKTGYDPEFRKSSPGLLLEAEVLQRAFANPQVEEGDTLGILDEWKSRFRPQTRQVVELSIFGGHPLGHAAYRFDRHLWPQLKQLRQRASRENDTP